MPDRWAVIAVHKDAKGRIETYRCVKVNVTGQPYQAPTDFTRDQVLAAIRNKQDFWTARLNDHERFAAWGAPLEIALKTYPDDEADNLENLPTF